MTKPDLNLRLLLMINKKNFIFFSIFVLLISCSFDNKTGIWGDSEKERKKIFQFFKSPRLKRKLLKRTKVINLKEVSRIMNLKAYDKKTLRYVVKI